MCCIKRSQKHRALHNSVNGRGMELVLELATWWNWTIKEDGPKNLMVTQWLSSRDHVWRQENHHCMTSWVLRQSGQTKASPQCWTHENLLGIWKKAPKWISDCEKQDYLVCWTSILKMSNSNSCLEETRHRSPPAQYHHNSEAVVVVVSCFGLFFSETRSW